MKKSANRNQFLEAAQGIWDIYSPYLAGNQTGLLCAVSQQPLGEAASEALMKSAPALGLGDNGCCFITTTDATQPENVLGAYDLRTLVEACDPLALVVCDAATAHLLSHAYETEVPTNRPCRVMGRTCVAFVDFQQLTLTPADKQRAWHLLKQLAG